MLIFYPPPHIASLLIAPSLTRTKYKMAMIIGLTYEDYRRIYERSRLENLKEVTTGVQQLVKLLSNYNFIKTRLVP